MPVSKPAIPRPLKKPPWSSVVGVSSGRSVVVLTGAVNPLPRASFSLSASALLAFFKSSRARSNRFCSSSKYWNIPSFKCPIESFISRRQSTIYSCQVCSATIRLLVSRLSDCNVSISVCMLLIAYSLTFVSLLLGKLLGTQHIFVSQMVSLYQDRSGYNCGAASVKSWCGNG